MNKKDSQKPWRLLWLILGIAAVIFIIILKVNSDPSPLLQQPSAVVSDTSTLAIPDTSASPLDTVAVGNTTLYPQPSYSLHATDSATITQDKRPATEAGYEDGYAAGVQDAAIDRYHDSYDETNAFVGTAYDHYVQQYRAGYEAAYQRLRVHHSDTLSRQP